MSSTTEASPSTPGVKLGLSSPSPRGGGSVSSNKGNVDQVVTRISQGKQHRLDLDSEGNLRLNGGPTVLLNGLTPSVWSASRPESTSVNGDNYGSLFLHARYADELAEHENKLGDLVACNRLLACSRVTRYWMGPKVGTSARDVPFDTQFLLIETQPGGKGPYALVLPLVDNGFRASLHYGDEGSIEVVCLAESGDAAVTTSGMRALYVAVGDDPYKLLEMGFRQVADATGTFETRERKILPPCIDDFGWCTWDAFYSKVTPKGVLDGVTALKEAGVPPRTVILDDGWQQVTPSPPDWKDEDDEDIAPLEKGVYDGISDTSDTIERSDSGSTGGIAALIGSMIGGAYDKYVKKAAYGSTGNRIWSTLSKTLLKGGLWNYFDQETDFNRQLSGFPANHKFESNGETGAGGGAKSLKDLVSKLKEKLGVKNVLCWHALHGYWRVSSHFLI